MSFFHPSLESSHHENSHPSATPAEAGVHGSSTSLSEAFLDSSVSRVRDSVPEQYRQDFDELRQNILDFCKIFSIPPDLLNNLDAFQAHISSRNPPLSFPDLQRFFHFLQRFEYLVSHKDELTEVERLYHLKEQYTSQVALLEQTGVLKDGSVMGIDGQRYPIPTLEQITQRLYEQRETLAIKQSQGFTKLLLVPFGMSLDEMMQRCGEFLRTYKSNHADFSFDEKSSLMVWDGYGLSGDEEDSTLVYFPQSLDGQNHHGKTKREILREQDQKNVTQGWRVLLLQPSRPMDAASKGFALIPRDRKGGRQGQDELHKRSDLEANRMPLHYFQELQEESSPYYGESGMTPEDWFFAFMTHLQETGEPLDNYQNEEASSCYLLGAFFPDIPAVSRANWAANGPHINLWRGTTTLFVGWIGIRTAVVV